MVCGLGGVAGADVPPQLSEEDPNAKALHYVTDAARSPDPSQTCSSCALYQGDAKSVQAGCLLFPKQWVRAAGSCSSWAPQM